jgi:hypothetical protein
MLVKEGQQLHRVSDVSERSFQSDEPKTPTKIVTTREMLTDVGIKPVTGSYDEWGP